jgi:hypothetical protein
MQRKRCLSESSGKSVFRVSHKIFVVHLGRFQEGAIEEVISKFLDAIRIQLHIHILEELFKMAIAKTDARRYWCGACRSSGGISQRHS